jgi:hypothetical protein
VECNSASLNFREARGQLENNPSLVRQLLLHQYGSQLIFKLKNPNCLIAWFVTIIFLTITTAILQLTLFNNLHSLQAKSRCTTISSNGIFPAVVKVLPDGGDPFQEFILNPSDRCNWDTSVSTHYGLDNLGLVA